MKVQVCEPVANNDNSNRTGRAGRPQKLVVCVTNGCLYSSIKEAGMDLGVDPTSICYVMKGKRKRAGGHIFRVPTAEEIKKAFE